MNTHGRVATHEIDGNLIDVYYDEDASDPRTWMGLQDVSIYTQPWISHHKRWLSEVQNAMLAQPGLARVFKIKGDHVEEVDLLAVEIYPQTEEEEKAYDDALECDGYAVFTGEEWTGATEQNALELFSICQKWAGGEVFYIVNRDTGDGIGGLYLSDPHDPREIAIEADENGLLLDPEALCERILENASDQQERVMDEAWARCCKIRTQTKK